MVIQIILGAILVALYFFIGAIIYCYNFPADQYEWHDKILFGFVWPLIVTAWVILNFCKLPRKITNKFKGDLNKN
jgi:hypothetical protein